MAVGLEKTFKCLAETSNDAAVKVLVHAMDSADVATSEAGLKAILKRRSPTGQREVLRRLSERGERWQEIVARKPGRMTHALRDAVLGLDRVMCAKGCQAILWFREYDLVPALVNALEDPSNPNRDIVSGTLLEVLELLYSELAGPRDYRNRRDPQLVRRFVIAALEKSLARYRAHKRKEVIEAFLMLAPRDNALLRRILGDPHDHRYLAVIEALSRSQRPGVIRLVLSFLDDPHAPLSAFNVLTRRTDENFVKHLLKRIGFEPSAAAKRNLRRMEFFAWADGEYRVLAGLDDACQHASVQLLMCSGMKRLEVFELIKLLMNRGKPGGRRAAAEALAQFKGAEANALTLAALKDEDPEVQAIALGQVRQRGIPGTIPRLIEMLDSPYEDVRGAAREALGEFRFDRFLAAFDSLDDDVRHSTGTLVKKVDPTTLPSLTSEMQSKVRSRRLRAVEMASAIEAVPSLEDAIVELMRDDDHHVRLEAARALARGIREQSLHALREALADRSTLVQEAAAESLHQRQSAARQTGTIPLKQAVEQGTIRNTGGAGHDTR